MPENSSNSKIKFFREDWKTFKKKYFLYCKKSEYKLKTFKNDM